MARQGSAALAFGNAAALVTIPGIVAPHPLTARYRDRYLLMLAWPAEEQRPLEGAKWDRASGVASRPLPGRTARRQAALDGGRHNVPRDKHDRLRRAPLPRRGQSGIHAVTVISISNSGLFSAATVTVVRAGLFAGKYLAYSSL